jgi:hypothetical protein
MQMEQTVPKRRHIKFRTRGIAQKKEYKKYLFAVPTVTGKFPPPNTFGAFPSVAFNFSKKKVYFS